MDPKAEATALRQSFAQQVDAIHADTELTDAAKAGRVAELRESVATQMGQLRAVHEGSLREQADDLWRSAFGPTRSEGMSAGEATMLARDAADRAAQCTTGSDALRLLERANGSGDRGLARAVAASAWSHGWRDVIERYVALYPQEREGLVELQEHAQRLNDKKRQLTDSIHFSFGRRG